jgi:hypothetical protein
MRFIFPFLLLSGVAFADSQTTGINGTSRPITTVAGLPTCNANNKGKMFFVTDTLAPVALATVAGGGAVQIGVLCNGTNWIVQ